MKYSKLPGFIAIISIAVFLITGLFSCELLTGGTLRIYNDHNENIKVTVYISSKTILYED